MKTPRTLPIEIVRQYHVVNWRQFWNHNTGTPNHLWDGRGDREANRATVLCGKVIDDSSSHDVKPDEAAYFCRACVRIALGRAAKLTGTPPTEPPPVAIGPVPFGTIEVMCHA